jgi:hypothetical protein
MRSAFASVLVVVAAASLAASSCASAGRGTAQSNPNSISREDIVRGQQDGIRDLYELVGRIRPRWLQVRADRSLRLETLIAVYQNNSRLGSVDALRGYPLTNVSALRYLDAAQAGLLPGASGGHIEGAIVISTGTPTGRQ